MTGTTKDVASAKKAFKDMQAEAEADMKEFKKKQLFEMESECPDRNGNMTRVLEIDTDKPGILGLFMEYGNPFEFQAKGAVTENKKLIALYLDFMSNIDMTDDENLKAIGWTALPSARQVVKGFFMLRLVLGLNAVGETGK